MGERRPLVSVVIPAYAAEATLPATLRSVQAQTLRNIEIVVVDDGSRDGTADVVLRAAANDDRVRLVSQANAGVAAARNRGAEEARADQIAFVDADDLWRPRKLELQHALMEARGDATGLIYTWHCVIDEAGAVRRWSRRDTVQGEVFTSMLFGNLVGNGSSALVRRSAFEAVGGYDPGLRAQDAQGCEDLKFYLAVAERFEFGVARSHLTGYRLVSGSMSRSFEAMMRSHRLVLDPYRARFPQYAALIERHERLFLAWLLGRAVSERDTMWERRLYDVLRARSRRFAARALAMAHADPLLFAPRLLLRSDLDWRDAWRRTSQRFLADDMSNAPELSSAADRYLASAEFLPGLNR